MKVYDTHVCLAFLFFVFSLTIFVNSQPGRKFTFPSRQTTTTTRAPDGPPFSEQVQPSIPRSRINPRYCPEQVYPNFTLPSTWQLRDAKPRMPAAARAALRRPENARYRRYFNTGAKDPGADASSRKKRAWPLCPERTQWIFSVFPGCLALTFVPVVFCRTQACINTGCPNIPCPYWYFCHQDTYQMNIMLVWCPPNLFLTTVWTPRRCNCYRHNSGSWSKFFGTCC